jgi:hypothetical protein
MNFVLRSWIAKAFTQDSGPYSQMGQESWIQEKKARESLTWVSNSCSLLGQQAVHVNIFSSSIISKRNGNKTDFKHCFYLL